MVPLGLILQRKYVFSHRTRNAYYHATKYPELVLSKNMTSEIKFLAIDTMPNDAVAAICNIILYNVW